MPRFYQTTESTEAVTENTELLASDRLPDFLNSVDPETAWALASCSTSGQLLASLAKQVPEGMTPMSDDQNCPGSGHIVEDFSCLCEGDIDPSLNKKICDLIDSTRDYIVYLDEESCVEWSTTDSYEPSSGLGFSEVANATSELEAVVTGLGFSCEQRHAFGRILAEAMARVLGDKDPQKARESIEKARAFLSARSDENARGWYLSAALSAGAVAFSSGIAMWLLRTSAIPFIGETAFEASLATLSGALGAVVFVLHRSKEIEMNAAAGPFIHRIESVARVVMGSAGGLLWALQTKAGLVTVLNSSSSRSLAALLAAAFIAGFTERWVPSLIKQAEGSTSASTDLTTR